MDWLQSLLWDPSSVAHIVLLYAFVVAAGVYLGKIKIFGVSLGVTFVLFAGILMGHFGFTADTHILHFIREFGLILFVFCIGLQVGPSFFSSFKKGGMTLNLLAVGIVVLNIAVALGLYYLWNGRVELPMMVGILYGAVTNTPGLGAANEALNQLNYTGPQIALGYACAYPLGVVGIIGSIIALILFSPIMLIVAILVKKSSPGPIIFAQERIGLGNKPFKMYKFRSMGVQDPKKEAKEWTTKNDARVTPVGRVIRKTSLDELPQFWNVLKGDMSLIGPRPERPLFVEKFKEEIPRYMIKHQVRPGITGWAQVNGFRGDTSIRSRIEHDLYYIENWSLGLDIKILFLTFFKGFVNKNAY